MRVVEVDVQQRKQAFGDKPGYLLEDATADIANRGINTVVFLLSAHIVQKFDNDAGNHKRNAYGNDVRIHNKSF